MTEFEKAQAAIAEHQKRRQSAGLNEARAMQNTDLIYDELRLIRALLQDLAAGRHSS